MTFFSTAEKLELGGVPFIAQSDKPNRREALRYYQRIVRNFKLDVRQYESVERIERSGDFVIHTRRKDGSQHEYRARHVVIATGYLDTPVLMNVALDLYRWHARPTLVHFEDVLDPGVKPWILPDIMNRIKSGEIAVRWRSRVVEIRRNSVVLKAEDSDALSELPADFVFAMTGFCPDPRLLRSLGAHVDTQTGIPEHNPETMETNVPGVFIAGVIAAGLNANKIFIENGREHGPRIVATVSQRLGLRAK
jgi:thioredoxin reductase (NADPH)